MLKVVKVGLRRRSICLGLKQQCNTHVAGEADGVPVIGAWRGLVGQ